MSCSRTVTLVRLEPATSQSQVKQSTTESLHLANEKHFSKQGRPRQFQKASHCMVGRAKCAKEVLSCPPDFIPNIGL